MNRDMKIFMFYMENTKLGKIVTNIIGIILVIILVLIF